MNDIKASDAKLYKCSYTESFQVNALRGEKKNWVSLIVGDCRALRSHDERSTHDLSPLHGTAHYTSVGLILDGNVIRVAEENQTCSLEME